MADTDDLVISVGFSDAKLVAEANKVVAMFKKKGEEAQKAFVDAQGKVTNTQAVRAYMREMDRLAKTFDPVYRAAKVYEKKVNDLDRALEKGAISQQRYATEVGRAAKEFNKAANELDDVARKGVQGGTGLQNTAYQLQDVAVQIGAGTSAAQALGQQLPQLLSGFGTLGVLAGTAAAVVLPLGAYFLKTAFDSETLDDRLKELADTTEDYTAKAEVAARPIEDLRRQYGDLADEVQRANSTIAQMAGVRARGDTLGAARALPGGLGADLNAQRTAGLSDAEWAAVQSNIMDKLRSKTGATAEQADKLRMALNRIGSSNDLEAVVRDGENLLAVFADMATNADADQLAFLGDWGAQVQAVMQAAQDQIRATKTEIERVTEQYQTDTDKLKSLSNDREIAQKQLDDAIRTGNEEAVRAWKERLGLIDQEISKTQTLALENDKLFQAMQQRLQQRFPQLLDDLFEGAIGTSATQFGKDADASKRGIRELIKSRESGGDYNATLDNGAYTGGARDLVNMTINEVLEMQRDMLRHPSNKKNSSAAGAYQIVGKTLQSLVDELGLTGNELYDPQMQDRLADQLLRRRRGQGIEGLRQEWQGLENVSPALIQQALGAQSIPRVDPEIAAEQKKALDEQIRERERLAKQAKEYGDQLARNLLTDQETAKLNAQQAEQIAAIKAQNLSDAEESRAIADVTAEIEKQRTILALLADAKKRNVDLDAMLADGSMTYRQAIEALGEAKRAEIVATNERAIAEGKVAEAQQLMADAQERTKQGLLDSIVAGESFTQVLAGVAQQFAKVALEAALFNTGPWASGGSGGGILGGLWGLVTGRGFSSGGYTGNIGTSSIAGVVHGGEYVMSAPAVQRIGLPNLEAMHRGGSVGDGPKIIINNNAPGAQVSTEYATKDEVRLLVSQGIAGQSRSQSDMQYLRGGR